MAPTAAVDILLGHSCLHVMTEAEAQAGIYRVMCIQQQKHKSTHFGHTRKSQEMEHEPNLQMETERMIPRYTYYKP